MTSVVRDCTDLFRSEERLLAVIMISANLISHQGIPPSLKKVTQQPIKRSPTMSTTLHRQKSSLRERVKGKLLSPGSSIRLPKFLSHEPAAPARYYGTPICSGYVSPQEISIPQNVVPTSSRAKEQWYIPPDEPPPPPRPARRVTRSRDREPTLLSPRPHNSSKISMQLNGLLSPRVSSEPHFSTIPPIQPTGEVEEPPTTKSLVVHDLRDENRLCANAEIDDGLLYNLIQTIPETWLATPRIKESFIPLLRPDQATAVQQAPLPTELRLIDGFLGHLPELHIIPEKRTPPKPENNAYTVGNRNITGRRLRGRPRSRHSSPKRRR